MAGSPLPSWGRLSTSQRRLKVDWEFFDRAPVETLDAAAALREVRGKDPRPILLLRDCVHADKDAARIEAFLEEEKIVLATRWFHAVRVGRDVVKPAHPLHALFAGERAPHMAVISRDGSKRVDMQLMPTATTLWSAMQSVLKVDYSRPADASLAEWRALLSKFDVLDAKRAKLAGDRHRSKDPKKTAELEKAIEAIDEQKAKLHVEEKAVTDLPFRAS